MGKIESCGIKKSKSKKIIIAIICICVFLCIFIVGICNNSLTVTKYEYVNQKIPASFDGYKIVQISDFHCKDLGNDEQELISLIKKEEPDIICLTGDIVDEDHDVQNVVYLLDGLKNIAPVYYVTGNHDYYDEAPFEEFLEKLNSYGGCYLNNESVILYSGSEFIKLTGLDYKNYRGNMGKKVGNANLDYFNILLFHDSNMINWISDYGYDLVLSGHVHGGIVRLPIIGGVFGNDGSFFPKYDYGEYKVNNSTLISSSGLGDAIIPRFNNHREIVSITLHSN